MTLHWLEERRRQKAAVEAEEHAAELAWVQEVVDYIDREATNPVHIMEEQHVVADPDDGLRASGGIGPGWVTRRSEPAPEVPEPEALPDEPCDDRPAVLTGPDVVDLIGKIARESTPCRPHGAHWAARQLGDVSADPDAAIPQMPPWLEGPDDGAAGTLAASGDTGAPDDVRGDPSRGAGEDEDDPCIPAAAPPEEVAVAASDGGISDTPVNSCHRPAPASRVCRVRRPDPSAEDPLAALWALAATSPR